MEHRLYEAAVEGSIPSLHVLLGEDPEVLDKVIKINCFDETILHVAILQGHVDFVKEILERKPELAGELDSQLSSPLHLASANGQVEIVKALLLAKREMCGVLDRDGRNPLHVAAINGRVDALNQLVQICPNGARAQLDHGKTNIMHLCVQHSKLEALKLLVEKMNDEEFINSRDDREETVLHLAVADKQTETVKYLLSSTRIKVNEINVNGLTALDILAESQREVKDLEIGDSLRQAGALRAKDMSSGKENGTIRPNSMPPIVIHDQNTPLRNDWQHSATVREWLVEKRHVLMLVAPLIATMTFQGFINPPGGVWQDDSPENFLGSPVSNPHKAGEAVLVYNQPGRYTNFYVANLMGFVGSLSTIFLLVTALAFRSNAITGTLIVVLILVMCLTIISVLLMAGFSFDAITPDEFQKKISRQISKDFQTVFRKEVIIILAIIVVLGVVARCLLPLRRGSSSHGNGDQEAPLIEVDHVNHGNGDREAPQIQVDHVTHGNGGREVPQIQADHVNHDNHVTHGNGDREAPQIQVDHVNHGNGDREAPQIQVDQVNHGNGDREAPQIQVDHVNHANRD